MQVTDKRGETPKPAVSAAWSRLQQWRNSTSRCFRRLHTHATPNKSQFQNVKMLFLGENNSAVPALEDLLKKVKNVKPHLDINGSLSKAKM